MAAWTSARGSAGSAAGWAATADAENRRGQSASQGLMPGKAQTSHWPAHAGTGAGLNPDLRPSPIVLAHRVSRVDPMEALRQE